MLTLVELIVFIAVLLYTFYIFGKPLVLRYKLIRIGQDVEISDSILNRILEPIYDFFFLACSIKPERPYTGILHIGFLYGAVTFDSITVMHILEGFRKDWIPFGTGFTGNIWSVWVDFFAIFVFVSVFYFAIRRYVFRPDSYSYDTRDSIYIYTFLTTVTLTYLLYEGALIALNPHHARSAFVGIAIAHGLSAMFTSHSSRIFIEHLFWWMHILNVFAFIAYVPHSKYLHFITGPINIGLKNTRSHGIVPTVDIEDPDAEVFGVETLKDMTWKDLLDGFACMECGRCQDYCPAAQTQKALSPKEIILKMRNALLETDISQPDKIECSPLVNDVFSPEEIWACTTCGACVQVCPVKNEQFPKILKLRQSQVLMEGRFPKELKRVFKGLNTNANPWGLGASVRMDWAKNLEIPRFTSAEPKEYLLFLGCAACFDDRTQRVAKKMIQFLQQQNISFGIIGETEQCCGETARRLGEESIAQTLIEGNIEQFQSLGVKKILTICPHGYNTFKNEYPEFGGEFEVIHHSQFIANLLNQGKVSFGGSGEKRTVVIHDSCYLGRINGVYEPIRSVLNNIPAVQVREPELHREHAFCCGGGGGRFWMEEDEPRINHKRSQQLAEVNPDVVATSCPFCLRMLSDGMKDIGKENIEVLDLIELVADSGQEQRE